MILLFLAAGMHLGVPTTPAAPPGFPAPAGFPNAPGSSWLGAAIAGLPDGLPSYAQSTSGSPSGLNASGPDHSEAAAPVAPQLTLFDPSMTAPWFVGGQTNVIFQANTPFHSPYQGTNSFHNAGAYKTSLLGTLFTGVELGPLLGQHETRYTGEFIFQMESSGGRGLSNALGLAGFTNLDVVRNPNLGSKPYVARAMLSGTLGLTDETVAVERTPLSLATVVPARRFVLHAGKMSLPDFFDQNDVLSDSHLQFTNWTVDENGAWDYAADTRGYTYGGVLEYDDRQWSARYALALMPTVANGIHLDWALRRARSQNMEFAWRHGFLPGHEGVQRVLAFVNDAHMGVYREAVNAYLDGQDPTPEITAHAHFGDVKYGFGYNVQQQITTHMRAAARFGWNEGQHESFAYTEDDQTVLVGGDYDGAQWGRANDKFGLAFVSNAIKRDHQNYLADGGLGFLLGDGRLHYGRENITETYYNAHAWRGLFFGLGLTHLSSPGYNRDRGPVWVPSIRSHIDF
jgi:high affinity Mn2+ porin